ncbi:bcl-2-like protein 10 [Triplophysa dalaica]|uniref:bcl-2-like protein 10 n=1 Tax=Triplophysa dalaica TaxID=1582913 RepID=UPI0024DF7608|nr:bcl-2-like protein 10 [Triplophysa dalaica]
MSCWLREETFVLAEDYVGFCSGVQQTPPSESAQAMRYLAKEMEQQHSGKFRSLSQEFLDTCGSDPSQCLHRVMRELVGDGKLNWGRVVSIFAFTGVLASELLSRRGNSECSPRLAETVAEYLGGEKRDWLMENGGWEGFYRFFHTARELKQESSMKTALFAAAGVGLAGLTFLLVR